VANAAHWRFTAADDPPSRYRLATRENPAVTVTRADGAIVDFGQETTGFVKLRNLTGSGKVTLYYGESKEEALSEQGAETLDRFTLAGHRGDFVAPTSRAMRHVNIRLDAAVRRNVLTSATAPPITTPYMRFYELAALAESGQQCYVTNQIKDYWGGMLRAGATCFWEQYDPKVEGA